eukprot:6188774-Pleurochrysis_carterae.AAC.2
MASGSHVLLRSVLEFEEEEAQLRFDEASRRLVLIKHRQFLGLRLRHPAPVNNGMEQSRCDTPCPLPLATMLFCIAAAQCCKVRSDIDSRFFSPARPAPL